MSITVVDAGVAVDVNRGVGLVDDDRALHGGGGAVVCVARLRCRYLAVAGRDDVDLAAHDRADAWGVAVVAHLKVRARRGTRIEVSIAVGLGGRLVEGDRLGLLLHRQDEVGHYHRGRQFGQICA